MKVKLITRLIYGEYPYGITIDHPALRYKNIRYANRSTKLKKVPPYMHNISKNDLNANKSYFGRHSRPDNDIIIDDYKSHFASWDVFVDWYSQFMINHPNASGRTRREAGNIAFYCKEKTFSQELIEKFPEYVTVFQKPSSELILPAMIDAAKEKTWYSTKEYVDHLPYNQYKYRVYLAWEARTAAEGLIELFKGYTDADLIKLSSGFVGLLAGAGRLKFPAHILIKTEDALEMIKLALGPSLIHQIVEYILVDDVIHSSP